MEEDYETSRRREAEERRRTRDEERQKKRAKLGGLVLVSSSSSSSSRAPAVNKESESAAASLSASPSIDSEDQTGTFETSAATCTSSRIRKRNEIGVQSSTACNTNTNEKFKEDEEEEKQTSKKIGSSTLQGMSKSCWNNEDSDDDEDLVAVLRRLQNNKKRSPMPTMSMPTIEKGIGSTIPIKTSTSRQRNELTSPVPAATAVDESTSIVKQALPNQAIDATSSITANVCCSPKNISQRHCLEITEDQDTAIIRAEAINPDVSSIATIIDAAISSTVTSAFTTKQISSPRKKIDASSISINDDRTHAKPRIIECIDLVSSGDESESNHEQKSEYASSKGIRMDCPISVDDRKPPADQMLSDHEYAKLLQTQEEEGWNNNNNQQKNTNSTDQNHINSVSVSEAPIKIFATKSDERERARNPGNEQHWSRTQCWTLREMLGFDGGQCKARSVDWMVVSNFLIDCAYLLNEVPELISLPHCVVFYGQAAAGSFGPWKAGCSGLDVVHLHPAEGIGTRRIPYGLHHTKMFLVGFSDGTLRVIIHTANLLYGDIHVKAQTAYIQDFPLAKDGFRTEFEDDLVSYLETYNYTNKRHWAGIGMHGSGSGSRESLSERIRRYDFSSAKAVLIPSTPGYHKIHGSNRMYGHLKIRKAVREHAIRSCPAGSINDTSSIVCQFSSIGSLTKKYLLDLQCSMDANFDVKSEARKLLRLKLVFPTVEEVRTSIEGYAGGGSVPAPSKNVTKDFLQSLWHRWSPTTSRRGVSPNDNPLLKGKHIPHLKTFYQYDKDQSFLWLVLASHNLSKAALGEVVNSTKYGEQRFFVRHWEMGVFISSRLLGNKKLVPWSPEAVSSGNASIATIPLPFQTLPDAYEKSDEPWKWDVKFYPHPDNFGRLSLHDC